MGKITSIQSFRTEATLKILVQQEQFFDWLRRFFYISESLHKEFDLVYQQMYYVMLNQLLAEGIPYTQNAVIHLKSSDNTYSKEWFETLLACLLKIKTIFPDDELEYIRYKRHNVCHIFQNHYEQIQDSGKIVDKKEGKDLDQLHKEFQQILIKYNWDAGFDKYLTSTLYPILTNLHSELQHIHLEQMRETDL